MEERDEKIVKSLIIAKGNRYKMYERELEPAAPFTEIQDEKEEEKGKEIKERKSDSSLFYKSYLKHMSIKCKSLCSLLFLTKNYSINLDYNL